MGERKPYPNNTAPETNQAIGDQKKTEIMDVVLPPELMQAKAEVDQWFANNRNKIAVFLEYKNSHFKLKYNVGDGYYHQPGKDIISLDLQDFQDLRDKGMSVQQAIAFFFFHELSHLKMMLQEDTAGKKNMLEHFNYEGKKQIEDSEHPGQNLSLRSAYRMFYNILEDAIVNDIVLKTSYFGANFGEASRQAGEELRGTYIDKAFVLYLEVGEGKGDYAEQADPEDPKKKKIIFVGTGKGDLRIIDKEDHKKGFDMTRCRNQESLAGQFLTFFIKNQMLGLDPKKTNESFKGEGKIIVAPEVAVALNEPLLATYEHLLQRVVEKYQGNPEKLQRYYFFMRRQQTIRHFKKEKFAAKENKTEVVFNVADSSAFVGGELVIGRAARDFKLAIRALGIRNVENLTFIELFNKFKEKKASKEHSWTLPLAYNLEERTTIMRKLLEPIFTLLSILDDKFDDTLGDAGDPPGGKPKKEPKEERPEDEPTKKGEWFVGDKVRNNDKNSPYYGRKGVVREVEYESEGEDAGKAIAVRVDYYAEEEEKTAMAKSAKGELTGETENVFDPDENLIIIGKKGKGGNGPKVDDKRKKEFENEDDDDDEDDESDNTDEGDEGDEDDEPDNADEGDEGDEGDEKEKPSDKENAGKPQKPGKGSGGKPKKKDVKQAIEELGESLRREQERLEAEIEADEKSDKKAEQKEQENSPEATAKKKKEANVEKILEQLKKAEAGDSDGEPQINKSDDSRRELIRQMMDLNKEIAPYLEKMAADWMEIINNVATKIQTVKSKYHRSGMNMDMRRLQSKFAEIEAGMEYQNMLIYEQIIEKVMVELRPKMFRLILLLDNSGSMASYINQVRMSVMMINASLRSFRVLFRNKMEDVLGGSSDAQKDIVCDTEIIIFNQQHNLVKNFDINDLGFLDDLEAEYPEMDTNQEIVNTILAFENINPVGGTDDLSSWSNIVRSHKKPEIKRLLAQQKMTEIVFQVSDGEISNGPESTQLIKELQEQGIETFALAIGNDNAEKALTERHGAGRVIPANTPKEIAEGFGKMLKMAIQDKIAKVMEEALEQAETEASRMAGLGR